MPDIKPQLMADAQNIVQSHRADGGDINELVAKYATDRGYSPKVVDALTACVNRHSFKTAMQHDCCDEPAIADPAAVKVAQGKLTRPEAVVALPVKLASRVRSQTFTKNAALALEKTASADRPLTADYTRAVQQRLQRDKIACEAEVLAKRTEMRLGLEKMSHQAHLIKRLGLEKTAQFQDLLDACSGPVAAVLDEVIEKAASQRQERVGPTIAMLVPQALRDFENLKVASEHIVKLAQDLGAAQQKLAKINAALSVAKNGVIAHVE